MISVYKKLFATLFLIYSITLLNTSHAIEVVRADFVIQGVDHTVDFSLFDTVVAGTVTNFLSYVDDGSYNKLIINRSVPGFVIQGGAYTFDPLIGDFSYAGGGIYNGGLQLVSSKGFITNEFKLSNLRGTLAMARISDQNGIIVNSASNQWFVNLTDNTFLDTAGEGYTVFGEVLGSGMNVIDTIATFETFTLFSNTDIAGSFLSTPLSNYTTSSVASEISNNNLAMISSLYRLFSITDSIDFGDAIVGTPATDSVVIKNNNTTPLQIGAIDTSSITAPFTVTPCLDKLLQPGEECIIDVEFNPAALGYYAATFDVELSTYGHTIPVTLKTPAPVISAEPDVVAFGAQPVYDPVVSPPQTVIYLYNKGDRTLNLSSIQFDTLTPNEFQFIDNCTANSAHEPGTVPPDAFCILVVNFMPADLLEKSATININSDDPLNNQLIIPVTGGATTDNDDVEDSIEDAAPNAGDNNNDGMPDRLQNNVASFQAPNGVYTTLIADQGISFASVAAVQLSTLAALPQGVKLNNEAFTFELSGFPVGSIAKFGLILPAGASPSNIHSFGPTPDNNTPHWYTLDKDTSPGFFALGNYSLSGDSGSITRNLTHIEIVDGGYGDSDLQVNGKILFVGGTEMEITSSDNSGSMLWLLFLAPVSIRILRRNFESSGN